MRHQEWNEQLVGLDAVREQAGKSDWSYLNWDSNQAYFSVEMLCVFLVIDFTLINEAMYPKHAIRCGKVRDEIHIRDTEVQK